MQPVSPGKENSLFCLHKCGLVGKFLNDNFHFIIIETSTIDVDERSKTAKLKIKAPSDIQCFVS